MKKYVCWKEAINDILKEDIIDYYIIQNNEVKKSAFYFGVSYNVFLKILKFYNIHKNMKDTSFISSEKKRKHNTFNTSKDEEFFYSKLLKIFPKEDIFRQYKDPRYPFNCDFYIKSLDMFIELNFYISHGEHPFDPSNKNDLDLLESWKEKSKKSQFYKNLIETWTIKDPLKQKIAKENNLNYKLIYNKSQMEELFNELDT